MTGPAAGSGGIPTTDTDADACTTTPGNTVPGRHPVLDGALGDPDDPATYVPFLVDSHSTTQGTWVCVAVGSVRRRIVIHGGASDAPPSITFVPDATGPHVPTPVAPATPSGTCESGGGTRHVDMESAGSRVYAYSWQPTPTVVKLGVGAGGLVDAGGVLTVDTTAAGQAIPSVTTSTTDLTPCSVTVAHLNNPTVLDLSRSPTGALPASLCVTVGDTRRRITVSTGTGQPPASVTWTPDPGTP